MKEKILLTLSLISSIVLLSFSANTLEFINAKFSFSLVNFAGISSNENYITSAIVGYIFLIIFSLVFWKKANNKTLIVILFITSLFGFLFELGAISKIFSNSFSGQHLRFGILLSLLGFYIFSSSSLSKI
ncbi:hypothetical protein WH52_14045 [Tenacibaculum holothuriorum]|uniref:Uncharacterized protein n=1 Tax=Tenacibaculum holothuriorum TaxID=1635173 RepID=A0A1Y2P8Y3_9FLAO|nr:hypothetical protein [Tenacibaculum holothuriorum]OSY86902.1 hypothetical protein WH52_14045 [Tenacibaculum holothuriorum]